MIGLGLVSIPAVAAAQEETPPAEGTEGATPATEGATPAGETPPAEGTEGATPAEAGAEAESEERLPIQYVYRPLTLPAMILRADVEFAIERSSVAADLGLDSVFVGAAIGAGFGITGDLQVDATVAPLLFAPEFEYGDPDLTLTYRFLGAPNENFQMAVAVNGNIPVGEESDFTLTPGIPGTWLVADPVALSWSVDVPITFGEEVTPGLEIPIEVAVQVADPFHVALNTGYGMLSFERSEDIYIPLGLSAAYAIAGGKDGPLGDIYAAFEWPGFLTPGVDGQAVNAGDFVVALGFSGYFYF